MERKSYMKRNCEGIFFDKIDRSNVSNVFINILYSKVSEFHKSTPLRFNETTCNASTLVGTGLPIKTKEEDLWKRKKINP